MQQIDKEQDRIFDEHCKENSKDFESINKQLEELKTLLAPICETYKTVSQLGKWTMAIMVFFSISIGIVLSLRTLLK